MTNSIEKTDLNVVEEFLSNTLSKMNIEDFSLESSETAESVRCSINTNGTGQIIGYRGETLDALQYLCSLVLGKTGSTKRLSLDSEGYRERREKTLVQLAHNLEKKVKRTNSAVKLEPMNAYERRIIHTTLSDSQYVTTESQGVGNGRYVVLTPKVGDILNAPMGSAKKNLNFVYRSDKKKRR